MQRATSLLAGLLLVLAKCRAGADARAQEEPAVAEELVPGAVSLHTARFAPGGKALVCLSHATAVETGTHDATAALLKLPWPVHGGPEPSCWHRVGAATCCALLPRAARPLSNGPTSSSCWQAPLQAPHNRCMSICACSLASAVPACAREPPAAWAQVHSRRPWCRWCTSCQPILRPSQGCTRARCPGSPSWTTRVWP